MNCTASKSPKQRWHRRKDARPAEIVDAALTLFVERGFAATRLDQVAQLAGVSKGTLYLYFESKQALFQAVVQEMVLPELDRVQKIIDAHQGTAEQLLHRLVKEWWQNVGETRLSGIPKLIISEAGNFPELAQFFVDEVVHRGRALFVKVLKLGVAQGEFKVSNMNYAARALMAPMVFATIWKHSLDSYDSDSYVVQDYLDTHVDIFINGLRK